MIGIIALLVIVSIAIAYTVTVVINKQLLKSNINHFLHEREQRALSKINLFFTSIGHKHHVDLKNKLIDAGIYNSQLAKYYLPLKFGTLLVAQLLIIFGDIELDSKILLGTGTLIAILLIPDGILALRKKHVVAKTSRQLPYMLDMMAVCIQTGMTIESSLSYLSKELDDFDKDLCYHIRKTSDGAKVQSLEKALFDLSERLPTHEIRSFTLTLIQNLQHGTSISNVLSDLAEDMRKMHVLGMEEKIGKLAAKMSIPLILLIMFPIVILILAPGMMQISLDVGS
ncbi:type II secretion system F family protein [Moritella sp. 24]|uniref:type II secretion system F family protein n=1 Tax=Moritella sp. 24 TaxID=2746230 RepID=UPI001BAE3C0D|nr:type II secretion system F family protein [Moritella sp. 24]QUM77172.1 type II secretion system F family protein [Moritella sp. 24]